MKTGEVELLEHMIKSCEMGIDGINNVLKKVKDDGLKGELMEEIREYKAIHMEAERMLAQRGEAPKGIGMVAKVSSELMTEMQTAFDESTSKLADMMIKGTTMGVTKSLKLLNTYEGDEQVKDLCVRLRTLEENRISKLKEYL